MLKICLYITITYLLTWFPLSELTSVVSALVKSIAKVCVMVTAAPVVNVIGASVRVTVAVTVVIGAAVLVLWVTV